MTPWAWANATVSQMRSKRRRRSGSATRVAQVLVEPMAADALHRVEDATVGQRPHVVDGHEPGVLELGEDPGLLAETLGDPRRGLGETHHLERDLAAELPVVGQVDRGHSPLAEDRDRVVLGRGQVGPLGDVLQMGECSVG